MKTIWQALRNLFNSAKQAVHISTIIVPIMADVMHIIHQFEKPDLDPIEIEANLGKLAIIYGQLTDWGIPPEHVNALRDAIVAITSDLQHK